MDADLIALRDEIDALLSVNQDPVKYFDELLARNEKTLDFLYHQSA